MDKKLRNKLSRLVKEAQANWDEHRRLVKRTEDLINCDELWNDLKKLDKNFGRKVNYYPGDITTHRIAKTIGKLLEKK